jgi:hypothetical protein
MSATEMISSARSPNDAVIAVTPANAQTKALFMNRAEVL